MKLNINKDDWEIMFISALRNCLQSIKKEDMDVLQQIYENNKTSFSYRTIRCALDDLLRGDNLFNCNNNNENYNKIITDITTIFFNTALMVIAKKENSLINANIVLKTLFSVNYYTFNNVYEKDKSIERCQQFINENQSLINELNTKLDVDLFNDDEEDVNISLSNEHYDFICLNAVHYACGRRTYVPSIVCRVIKSTINFISYETKQKILNFINDKKEKDDSNNNAEFKQLGDYCDRIEWIKLLEILNSKEYI